MGNMDARARARKGLIMPAKCKTRNLRIDVEVLDLTECGCKIATKFVFFEVGGEIVLMPKGLDGFPGIVRWTDGSRAGIEFRQPLHIAVVDHLCLSYPNHKSAMRFNLGAEGPKYVAR